MGNPVNKVDVWGYAERGVINWTGCLINCQSTAIEILNPQIGLIGENQVTGTAVNGYYSWNGSSYSSVTLTMDTRIHGAESKEAVRMYEKAYNNINSGYLEDLKGYTHNYNRTALSYQKELRYKTNRTYHNSIIETAWYMISQQSREGEERKRNRELTGLDLTNQEYNEYEATQNYLKAKEEYEIHILIGEYISGKGIEEEDIIKGYNEKTKTLYTELIALEAQARSEGYYVENDRKAVEITGNVGKGMLFTMGVGVGALLAAPTLSSIGLAGLTSNTGIALTANLPAIGTGALTTGIGGYGVYRGIEICSQSDKCNVLDYLGIAVTAVGTAYTGRQMVNTFSAGYNYWSTNTHTEVVYSERYLTNSPVNGWTQGDPINNFTKNGTVPTWSTIRQRFWKNEALYTLDSYSSANLGRMQKGLAPQNFNQFNSKLERIELHHTPIPQREGGLFSFMPLSPTEHSLVDTYRFLKK